MKSLNIEICKSYNKEKFNIRIGDITGATECSNISYGDLLSEIKDAILELEE